jgi:hypothetical protein
MIGVDFGTDSVRSVVANARSGEVAPQAVSDDVLIDAWPCNHLAFAYDDRTAALAELAHRLDIGYRIFDCVGREFFKPS